MMKAIPLKVLLDDGGGVRMDQVLNDSLLISAFLAIVLAPMALALGEVGPGGASFAVPSLHGFLFSPQICSSRL